MKIREFLTNNLTDNTCYKFSASENELDVYSYLDRNRNPIQIQFNKNGSSNVEHICAFLNKTSRWLSEKLRDSSFIRDHLFLFNDEEYNHNTRDDFFSFTEGIDQDCLFDQAQIKTYNLVGYIKTDKISVNISSRFGDYFLLSLISNSDGFLELPEAGYLTQLGMTEWLLILIWKSKLLKAYEKGLPKEYVSRIQKLHRVRGSLILTDFIAQNCEIMPPLKCSYREHSFDNFVTRTVNTAFSLIPQKKLIQECSRIRHEFMKAVSDTTITMHELNKVGMIKNPYYRDYNQVIDLSSKIIKRQWMDIGDDKNEFSGFLFDVSMLFEYFIRKLLIRSDFCLKEKDTGEHKISRGIGNNCERKLIPDIIIKKKKDSINDKENIEVFDVKYKNFDFKYGVKREDLFQLHTYVGNLMNRYNVTRCGFIFPIEEDHGSQKEKILRNKIQISGKIVDFEIHFFSVPAFKSDLGDFSGNEYAKLFERSCNEFINSLRE